MPVKLGDRFVHLFGTTTELHAAEFGNNELEVFDLGLLRTDQCLEQGGVVGQRVGGEHAQSLRDYGCCEQPPKPLFMRIYGVSMCVPDDATCCRRAASLTGVASGKVTTSTRVYAASRRRGSTIAVG